MFFFGRSLGLRVGLASKPAQAETFPVKVQAQTKNLFGLFGLGVRGVAYVGLRPRRMAHKKMLKGFFKTHSGGSLRGTSLLFGNFGLRVVEGGRLEDKQIDAARTVMRRVVKEEKGANFHLKCFTDRPVTSKPAEVRMGKGKGPVEFFATWVPKGRVIFEISCTRKETGLKALRVAAAAIPLRTEIVRGAEEMPVDGYAPQLGVKPPRCLPFFIKRRLAEQEFRDKIASRSVERVEKVAQADAGLKTVKIVS
ncbi:hypothetical protein HK100_000741 [Physocladia obscura]|uniref:Mitochondrial ribosomal protein L16 n=1 Tax=Physocladia obscura TaxID=109957 RepID=A0AAD5SZN5_9FUNG|nr:hypothetical protein HK100_000741 [Physocladia obscura]